MVERPQISVRMLLALTAAIAAALALCATPREWNPHWRLGVFTFIVMASAPASAIVGIVYGGPYGRAFSIGVLTSSSWLAVLLWPVMREAQTIYVGQGTSFASGSDFFVFFARSASHDVGAFTLCSFAVGFICTIVCWCLGPTKA
jgi:hypothetical protein